jgi:hypothetical protein
MLMAGFGVLARREFWNPHAYNALAGAVLTVLGAGEAVFVNEGIKRDIAGIDQQIAATGERLAAIDRALFQFRFAQTNAITFGVLSANDALKPEFRKNMVDLMFVTRRLPTEVMLQQIYGLDDAGFQKDRQAYEGLIEAAKAATSQADWNAVNDFEFARESQLFAIEQTALASRDSLAAERRKRESRLTFAITLGFALQQIGFVVVLLSGLLARYRPGGAPAPETGAVAR